MQDSLRYQPLTGGSEGFAGLGIAPQLLKTLDYFGFRQPTEAQKEMIPQASVGQDIMAYLSSQSGKELAYCVPLVQRLMLQGGTAIILVPTHESAMRVGQMIKALAQPLQLSHVIFSGRQPIQRHIQALESNPDIIIATPGRLHELLDRGACKFAQLQEIVFDGAHQIFSLQGEDILKHILANPTGKPQIIMISPITNPKIEALSTHYLNDPLKFGHPITRPARPERPLRPAPRATQPKMATPQIPRDPVSKPAPIDIPTSQLEHPVAEPMSIRDQAAAISSPFGFITATKKSRRRPSRPRR